MYVEELDGNFRNSNPPYFERSNFPNLHAKPNIENIEPLKIVTPTNSMYAYSRYRTFLYTLGLLPPSPYPFNLKVVRKSL